MSAAKNTSQRRGKISPDIHVDDNFLQEDLRELRSEMAWRRELEFRLVQFLLIFYPVIGSAIISLFQSSISIQAFKYTIAGACLLTVFASLFVTDRIIHEHKAFTRLGHQVQKIWQYFGLFEVGAYLENETMKPPLLLDKQKGFGQGQGYKKTILLIWFITLAMISVFTALALLKT